MASNKYTLQDALHGQLRKSEKRPTEGGEKLLFSDLKELRDTLEGQERVDAFIVRIQRYATESMNLSVDDDFKDIEQDTLDQIQRTIRDILRDCISLFMITRHNCGTQKQPKTYSSATIPSATKSAYQTC